MNRPSFNSTVISIPAISWVENSEKLKNMFTTEAGTEIDLIVRAEKLSVSASYKCTDNWLQTFMSFRDLDSFTLTRYNPRTKLTETKTVRMTDFNYGLVRHSDELSVTNGVWEISFNLEEF